MSRKNDKCSDSSDSSDTDDVIINFHQIRNLKFDNKN